MKRIFLFSFFIVGLAFLLPLLLSAAPSGRTPAAVAPSSSPTSDAAAAAAAAEPAPVLDESILLSVQTADGITEMSMAEYLPGALAGEMPAAFHAEALKAQAVALRTFALHYRADRKTQHPDADICTSSSCCAAYSDPEMLQARWGDSYAYYMERIREAVNATDGQYLVYDEQPILAVFHAASRRQTESGVDLGLTAPYLQSVSTPETPDTVNKLVTEAEVSAAEFQTAVSGIAPQADFSGAPGAWLGDLRRNEAGRVDSISIGGAAISGLALRQLFALRSTDFTLIWDKNCFRFTVSGYGHGAGMSQNRADLMAEAGEDYAAILAHYYPGTELVIAVTE